MEVWEAIIMGLIQGFTEFLPISSSGHLVLAQSIMGIGSANLMFFNVMLHLATLFAVCLVLYKEIWSLLKKPFSNPVLLLVIASIPAGILGVVLSDTMDNFFAGTKYLWIFFLITAVVLFLSDFIGKKIEKKNLHANTPESTADNCFPSINYKNVLFMGIAQACAIFPGISRSGSTIASGVFSGSRRSEVARFSFLMSIPIILASVLLEGVKLGISGDPIGVGAAAIVAGMLAAALSGYLAIKFMLKLVEKCQLKWFSLYLVIIAIVVIVNNFVGMWPV